MVLLLRTLVTCAVIAGASALKVVVGAAPPALRPPPPMPRVADAPLCVLSPPWSVSTDDGGPPAEVLYDGNCMVCLTNKAVLSFFDRSGSRLKFVNIREPSYTASEHGGVEFADAMRHFHVVEADGDIATGSDAVLAAYSKVGLGWIMTMLRFPLIHWLVDLIYRFVSKHRYRISQLLPGGAALARAVDTLEDMSKAAGGEGCEDEEECLLPDYDDEEE